MRKARLDELDLKPRVRNALASLFERLADETWRQIDRLVLYGSVARGDDLDDSDMDLLVVWKGDRVEGTDRFGV